MDFLSGLYGFAFGIVGPVIFAFATAKAKKVGEIEGIEQKLTTIIHQELEKARAIEHGKRIATVEDIDLVRAEVRAVTREAETIKSQMAFRNWFEQNALVQRRKCYRALIRKLEARRLLMLNYKELSENITTRTWMSAENQKKLRDDIESSFKELRIATHEARIFGCIEASKIMSILSEELQKISFGPKIADAVEGGRNYVSSIDIALGRLISAAQMDLHLEDKSAIN